MSRHGRWARVTRMLSRRQPAKPGQRPMSKKPKGMHQRRNNKKRHGASVNPHSAHHAAGTADGQKDHARPPPFTLHGCKSEILNLINLRASASRGPAGVGGAAVTSLEIRSQATRICLRGAVLGTRDYVVAKFQFHPRPGTAHSPLNSSSFVSC